MMLHTLKRGLAVIFSLLLISIFLFTIGILWPTDAITPIKSLHPVVIKNVAIVDIKHDRLIAQQTVVIEQGKITRVTDSSKGLPANAQVIDGSRKFLMPSLWDMHSHVLKITPLLDMPLYIRYGVTNVRDLMSCPKAGDPVFACPEDFQRWTQQAENAEIIGPRIQGTASFHLNGSGMHDYIKGLPQFFSAENEEQAREFVRFYAGKVDAIKVYNHTPKSGYFALVDEAQKYGLAVIGHRPREISAIDAAKHQKSIEHARFILHESFPGSEALRKSVATGSWREDRRRMLDEHQPDKAQAIFSAMRESGSYYVPTHLTRRVDAYGDSPLILEDPALDYLHPLLYWQWIEDVNKTLAEAPLPAERQTYREFYEKGLEITGQAHQAGVKVLAGSDYIVAGITLHDELGELVKAGLTPAQALAAATTTAAEYFGLEQQYGFVGEGAIADLILLNKNPLSDIKHTRAIDSVIFAGNVYDSQKLEGIDQQVRSRARSWSIACKIIWEFIKSPASY